MSEIAKRINKMTGVDHSSICYWNDEDGLWWLYIPLCGAGVLKNHTVQEHDDGTITVSPSIVMTGHLNNIRHGFLERGVWREV